MTNAHRKMHCASADKQTVRRRWVTQEREGTAALCTRPTAAGPVVPFAQPSEAKVANEEERVEAAPTKFGLVLAAGWNCATVARASLIKGPMLQHGPEGIRVKRRMRTRRSESPKLRRSSTRCGTGRRLAE